MQHHHKYDVDMRLCMSSCAIINDVIVSNNLLCIKIVYNKKKFHFFNKCAISIISSVK